LPEPEENGLHSLGSFASGDGRNPETSSPFDPDENLYSKFVETKSIRKKISGRTKIISGTKKFVFPYIKVTNKLEADR